ncbi:MAG: phage protein GemA/Gp16 family protein [Sodalis sp. (in: enterobacteria)]|uniref:phage protein GemA/Gp16 family protein n=1 Tax=Sodalis sp. (in: enterobacteria) TaxID=1898979 RepID=UPI003F2D3707
MKNLIKVVHTGKNKLDWDEETYRGILLRETGKNSARDCTAAKLARVLRCMRSQGFTTLPKQGRKPRVAAGRQGMLSKIVALLASAGRPWDYLNGMIARMLGKKARRMAR